MNRFFQNIPAVERCPGCYSWFPIQEMKEVAHSEAYFTEKLEVPPHIKDNRAWQKYKEKHKYEKWCIVPEGTFKMCDECIGRIDFKNG